MAQAPVELGVLGALEVRRDEAEIALPGLRRRTALAALAVHAPHPVSADALVEAVWGDTVPGITHAALHTVVSRLRGALGENTVRYGPAGYTLALGAGAVDADRFTVLCAQAAAGGPGDAAALLDQALGLWRGPAYAEFADLDFARAEAVRLDELHLDARENRARAALDLGTVESAVTELESLVAEQPLREQARALLMTALYRAGRPSEALDRFEELRHALREELGLDPSPALHDLHRRILDHRVPGAAPPPHSTVEPPVWPSRDTAFIGREDESALLLRSARDHRLVTVSGPGGVGKTRLIAETLSGICTATARQGTVVSLEEVLPGEVTARITAVLGLGPGPEAPREAMLEHLARSPLILVLDGCEHVLDEVRGIADAVLRTCPQVRLLLTSRTRLGLTDENLLPLEPLAVPAPDAPPTQDPTSPAERLLLDRIRRLRPAFTLSSTQRTQVSELCRLLDGLPLALEMVAPQVAALGLAPVCERIGAGTDLSGSREFGADTTLLQVVGRSLDMLRPGDLRLLVALTSFSGRFDLRAVEGVRRAGSGTAPDVESEGGVIAS